MEKILKQIKYNALPGIKTKALLKLPSSSGKCGIGGEINAPMKWD